MAALLPTVLCFSPKPSLLAGGSPAKAAARRAYGTQLPNRDQGMVPCQDHLTAWHSPPEPPVSGGKCWHSAKAHSLRLAPQLQAVLEPVGPRDCVRVGLWLGAMLEEGGLPQGHAPSQAKSLCPSRGVGSPQPCHLGRTVADSLPQLRGCSCSTRVRMGGNGPSAPSPYPGAAIALPGYEGMAPGAGACRISLFKWGFWHLAKQHFMLSNILANHISALVEASFAGETASSRAASTIPAWRGAQPCQTHPEWELLLLGCPAWGALGPQLGRVTGEQ